MTGESSKDERQPLLSDQERARIREEMQYALVVMHESRPPDKPKSLIDKLLAYLSNGFVLLIVGALISSVMVPQFQRAYDDRKQQLNLMHECFGEFLLYSNSIWQEYYTILPLTQELEIDKPVYNEYLAKIAQVKLKRYDAFAKVQALAVVFRQDSQRKSPVESALKTYAIKLNTTSAAVDRWLTRLYCTPVNREESPCETFDPSFDAFGEFEKIKELVIKTGNEESENVATLMVQQINYFNKGGTHAFK